MNDLEKEFRRLSRVERDIESEIGMVQGSFALGPLMDTRLERLKNDLETVKKSKKEIEVKLNSINQDSGQDSIRQEA